MLLLLTTLLLAAMPQAPASPYPTAPLANDRITAIVYLPDAARGYYRGTRFDWSGAIARLQWNGHEYFGPWFERHDPLGHDGITGPVEEFVAGDSSVGYDQAPVGGTFLRIGVGHVRKPAEPAYRRFGTYDIVDPGTWTVAQAPGRLEFVHRLDEAGGYAYEYRKTLSLEGDTLIIYHALCNTGRARIETTVYNHNFFTLDDRPTDEHVRVHLAFDPTPTRPLAPLGTLAGRTASFTQALGRGEFVYTEFEGFDATASHHDIHVQRSDTGAAVRIRGDRPLVKFVYWSASRTVCPEPYVDASVDPGQTRTWRTTYEFQKAAGGRQ